MRNRSWHADIGWVTRQPIAQRAGSPGDIACGNDIGISLEPTRLAAKPSLQGAVATLSIPTAWACTTGVAGIDKDDVDSPFLSLVGQESLQLTEGPGVENVPLGAPDPNALTDTCEVFQGQCSTGMQAIHDAPADGVIEPSHVMTLSPRKPAQQGFSPTRCVGLESRPLLSVKPPNMQCLLTAKDHPVRGYSKITKAEINAYGLSATTRGRHRLGKNDVDIEHSLALAVGQHSRRGFLAVEQAALIVADLKREPHGPLRRGQRYFKLFKTINDNLSHAENPLIVVHTGRPETGGLSLQFQINRNPSDGANGQVGTQPCGCTNLTIAKVVQAKPVRGSLLSSCPKDLIASIGETRQRLLQRLASFIANLELTLNGLNKFHWPEYIIKRGASQGTFLSRLKAGVSCA